MTEPSLNLKTYPIWTFLIIFIEHFEFEVELFNYSLFELIFYSLFTAKSLSSFCFKKNENRPKFRSSSSSIRARLLELWIKAGTHPEILNLQVKFHSRLRRSHDLGAQLQSGRFRAKPEQNCWIGLARAITIRPECWSGSGLHRNFITKPLTTLDFLSKLKNIASFTL